MSELTRYRRKAPPVEAIRIQPGNLEALAALAATCPELTVEGERTLLGAGDAGEIEVRVDHRDGHTSIGKKGHWLIRHGGHGGHVSVLPGPKFKARYEPAQEGA